MTRWTANPTAGTFPILSAFALFVSLAVVSMGAFATPGPGLRDDDRLSMKRHYFVLNGLRRVPGQWGELLLPENRGDRASREIPVTFGRLPATNGAAGVPIFFIAGGPGASGIGSFASNAEWLLPLRQFGDVVLVEQRGTGHSRPRLDCAERWDFPITTPLRRDQLIESARERFAACRRAWQSDGIDLAGYNTVAYAEDIVAVADSLGYRHFAVVAFSYGSQIALELLRSHSDRISRAVLLGVMGTSDSLRNPMDHDAVLARAAQLLKEDAASSVYPDLVTSTSEVIAMLRGSPVQVTIEHPEGGAPTDFVFDELAYRRQMVTRLGIRSELAILPRFNRALLSGEDQEWLRSELKNRLRGLLWMRKGPLAMRSAAQHYATVCAAADPAPRSHVPSNCVLGHTFHPALPEACDAWQVPNLGDAFRQPPKSNVPVLMFSAELDTKTPLEQAQRLLPHLSNVHHIVLANAGHDDLLEVNEAVRARMRAFFEGAAVSASPIVLEPIQFAMPSEPAIRCTRPNCASHPWSSPFAGLGNSL
ncbi:MAG: alpha/beta fold hydrolase [Gammaproteobacteria bacterium]|nr:alpha/beta fold hydrolase [Gammaproteobacteria bacterium]MDX2462586.1 alpha/beta fold hydrolase [Gammaproteobacteria bacterium]